MKKNIYKCPNCRDGKLVYGIPDQILGNNCNCGFPRDSQKETARRIEKLTLWPNENKLLKKLRGWLNLYFYYRWLKNKKPKLYWSEEAGRYVDETYTSGGCIGPQPILINTCTCACITPEERNRCDCGCHIKAGSPEYQKGMEAIMVCPNCKISMKTVFINPMVKEFAVYECPECKLKYNG